MSVDYLNLRKPKTFYFVFRSVIEPIRNASLRPTDHFHLSKAIGIDFKNRALHVESVIKPYSTYDLTYDKLVIGVGSLSNTFNTPGVTEHAFFLKVRIYRS